MFKLTDHHYKYSTSMNAFHAHSIHATIKSNKQTGRGGRMILAWNRRQCPCQQKSRKHEDSDIIVIVIESNLHCDTDLFFAVRLALQWKKIELQQSKTAMITS